jgi:FKBP-type peptidyl-prolyl cis-trans isomerase 2
LKSGEIVASTDPVKEDRPKSNLFVPRAGADPLALTALSTTDSAQVQEAPYQQRSLEEEISRQLSGTIVGMKEGDTRLTEIRAVSAPAALAEQYNARLSRVRVRPKEMKMPKGDYEYLTGRQPEVGQTYSYDPDFPGIVAAVSEKEVTIRHIAVPGTVLSTPFGPGLIKEEGPDYKVDIDARTGVLVRAAGMVGRVTGVDDKVITVDFGNSFGGETLLCDVTVAKITDAGLAKNGE